jgi:hypothetical protein
VEACAEAGLTQYKGLAYERAGFVFAARSDTIAKSEDYFDRALSVYGKEWGSCAKVEWLQQKQAYAMPKRPREYDRLRGKDIEVPLLNAQLSKGDDKPAPPR